MLRVTFLLINFIFISATSCSAKNGRNASSQQSSFKNQIENRQNISAALSTYIKQNKFPEVVTAKINSKSAQYKLNYTIEEDMQKEAERLLRRYKPDYGAVVMMDAETGQILAMVSQERANSKADNLNLRATFPAASVFKVITAAAAIDSAGIKPTDKIAFNGSNYAVHRQNMLSDRVNRWTQFITLKDAFARSINTAFGRLTLENLKPTTLEKYAEKFMFNAELNTDFSVQPSHAIIPSEKGYELGKIAAGYNRTNTISPIHGAMIAASIINGGRMVSPYIIESAQDEKGKVVYEARTILNDPVISKDSAQKLQKLMERTVEAGTSRTAFRPLIRNKKFKELNFGGKTGHFTGNNPRGSTDWFVGYADNGERKIAIAAVTVNIKKWTVKSSSLAQMMFHKYFKPLVEERRIANVGFKNERSSNN